MTKDINSVLKWIRKTSHISSDLFDLMNESDDWIHEMDGAGDTAEMMFYNIKTKEVLSIILHDEADEREMDWFKDQLDEMEEKKREELKEENERRAMLGLDPEDQ